MERVNPFEHGIYSRLIEHDQIIMGAWLRAHAESHFVGTCRVCGGYLRPITPYVIGQVEWYEARCVQCEREILAPDGRVLRRSGRRSEQPVGWWEQRMKELTAHG